VVAGVWFVVVGWRSPVGACYRNVFVADRQGLLMRLESRAGWKALPASRVSRMLKPATGVWLHHSVSADGGASTVRSIQKFHMNQRGWVDIGYSWVYSPSERTFYEARGKDVVGAHTNGQNGTTEGLCVLGNFETQRPPSHVVDDVAAFLQWRGLPLLGGHKDAPQAATACPGRHLYDFIPAIRKAMKDPTITVEENDMPNLSVEAQDFYQKQYELFMEQDVRPSTVPTLIGYYRHVRGWFVK
jgi:hypothetical protein